MTLRERIAKKLHGLDCSLVALNEIGDKCCCPKEYFLDISDLAIEEFKKILPNKKKQSSSIFSVASIDEWNKCLDTILKELEK